MRTNQQMKPRQTGKSGEKEKTGSDNETQHMRR